MGRLISDSVKVTLYKVPRSVGQRIQFYEDTQIGEGNTYIKVGHFYREVEIDEDGHFSTMLGYSHLETDVTIKPKKYGRRPRGFA